MQVEPYLHFPGTCEEALRFYSGVFGGEITYLGRFGESPMAQEMPPERHREVMHATFRAPGVSLMASDGREGAVPGDGISLSVATADVDEGREIFERLAEGGTVAMPYAKQFWGATFGMLRDRFGVNWMVNAGAGAAR